MQPDFTINNELKELNSLLANIPKTNVFTVPNGYFESLSADIMHGINDDLVSNKLIISGLEADVPAGYFDGLADSIFNKIKLEEHEGEQRAIALRSVVGTGNIFSVPDGYFNGLATSIQSKVLPTAPVITMKPRRSVFYYAIAAALTGLLGLSLFSIFDDKSTHVSQTTTTTFAVSDDTNKILENENFDKMMESLGDDEILSYLKNNGEDVNAALVASISEDKILPNVDAYYIDENALDNLLTELNINKPGNN